MDNSVYLTNFIYFMVKLMSSVRCGFDVGSIRNNALIDRHSPGETGDRKTWVGAGGVILVSGAHRGSNKLILIRVGLLLPSIRTEHTPCSTETRYKIKFCELSDGSSLKYPLESVKSKAISSPRHHGFFPSQSLSRAICKTIDNNNEQKFYLLEKKLMSSLRLIKIFYWTFLKC